MSIKKIFAEFIVSIVILSAIFVTASAASSVTRKQVTRKADDGTIIQTEIISTEKGVYDGITPRDFVPQESVYDAAGELEMDQFMARQIADVIFKKRYGNEFMKNTIFRVYEIYGKDIFVVARFEEDSLGGDRCIAIDKKTGQILKIWGMD